MCCCSLSSSIWRLRFSLLIPLALQALVVGIVLAPGLGFLAVALDEWRAIRALFDAEPELRGEVIEELRYMPAGSSSARDGLVGIRLACWCRHRCAGLPALVSFIAAEAVPTRPTAASVPATAATADAATND